MNDSLDPILQQEEQRKLRIQLMWRLGIAAALVAGVLGTLAWLDAAETDPKPQMTVTAPRDVRIASPIASLVASSAIIASKPASFVDETASSPEIASSIATASPEPSPRATASAPIITTPPRVTATLLLDANISTPKPATSAIAQPAKPVVATPSAVKPPVAPAKPVQPVLREPVLPKPENLARKAAAPAARYPAPVLTSDGYTIQTGVFLHAAKAEQMLKQVQNAGIPAYMETRVQIGPFKSRIEAETATQKLRQLGIEPVIKGE